jgi:hypothetical protein
MAISWYAVPITPGTESRSLSNTFIRDPKEHAMKLLRKFIPSLIVALAAVLPLAAVSSANALSITERPQPRASSLTSVSQPIGLDQARKLFNTMAAQKDISFRFPTDGCYARAHIMVRRLQHMGYKPGKVWSFARKGESLRVKTANDPKGFVQWGYHVAPTIKTRLSNGKVYDLVIDPSMFRGLVTVSTWAKAQKTTQNRLPFICKTRIGQAPTGPDGKKPGTGYWPGADPKRGADFHAVNLMKYFKPYEGRTAPKPVLAMATKLAA